MGHLTPYIPGVWHHHGEWDTYAYVVSGNLKVEYGTADSDVVFAGAGDLVHVPPFLIHRDTVEGDSDAEIIVFRAGKGETLFLSEGPADES
nr:cupin domain-containing protein [Streptomyces chartreusis]